jgi:hypothetical protein
MQLMIYHGPEPRKTLVAIAGATLRVGAIDLKSGTVTNELVYECVGTAQSLLTLQMGLWTGD